MINLLTNLAQTIYRLSFHLPLRAQGVSTRFESYGVAAGEPERMVRDALEGVRGKNFIGAAP